MPRKTYRPGDRGWPLGYPEIGIFLGATRKAVERWKDRGQLPPPDGRVGGSPYWWEDTIRAWMKKIDRWPGDDVALPRLYAEMEHRAAERKLEEELIAEQVLAERKKATLADLRRLADAAAIAEQLEVTRAAAARAAAQRAKLAP